MCSPTNLGMVCLLARIQFLILLIQDQMGIKLERTHDEDAIGSVPAGIVCPDQK